MIAGRVGDKTQPITLILHPDIVDDILRLTFEMHFDEKKNRSIICFESTQGLTIMTQEWWNLIDKNLLNPPHLIQCERADWILLGN